MVDCICQSRGAALPSNPDQRVTRAAGASSRFSLRPSTHNLKRIMDDSDDYGDLDDSAFLEAATQAEQTTFSPSPRPAKRRRIDAVIPSLPPSRAQNTSSGPFESDDEDEEASVSTAASRPKKGRSARSSASPTKQDRRDSTASKENGSPDDQGLSKNAKKKKERIHQPTKDLDMTDIFYTQPPQEHSPPWKPRGAIWQKPTLGIGVHPPKEPSQPQRWSVLETLKTMALPGRQSISSRPVPRQSTSANDSLQGAKGSEVASSLGLNEDDFDYDPTDELADLPSDAFASSQSSPQKRDNDVVLVSERRTRLVAPQTGLRQTTLFGRDTAANGNIPSSQANKRYNYVVDAKVEPPTHHKLDLEAAKTWVYPTNIGVVRDYQFNIVAKGLFHNLLVALPTGLGKTFIAATIMLNWYRWTTSAQIVFVAPTKPLVAQQVDACFNIAGIPRSHTTMLTGGASPGIRAEEWKSKRVFFMTPQTLLNDLKTGIADPKNIVLLVVDEAHKATGSYAYVEVVSLMRRFNPSYRILALTATPGADVEAVQKVIDGLDISRIEIRTENSLDIRGFVHQRSVEKQIFSNSDEMEMCMELYSQAIQPLVRKVYGLNAFWSPNPLDLTPYGCTQASRKWFQDAGRNASPGEKSMVMTIFTILGSLSQGMELLKYHGIGPFYTKMKEFQNAQIGSKSKYKKEILESKGFRELMSRLQVWISKDDFVGHPKLECLQQVILDHFLEAGEGRHVEGAPPSQTRIMVFAHFRDSAEEIVRVLKKHEPMIRPRVFVGQSSGKNSDGMTQKDQLEVIEKFKAGTFNTLVATSIGEEGLDIGEVDLIVCYDSKASPIRMLQRMGRTGRKRQGRIVLLQMKGKEEQDSLKAKDSYEKMQELIAEGSSFTFHDDVSRRILPREVQPVVDKREIEVPLENSQSDFLPEPRKRGRAPKRPPKKFHMPDGVITGFVTANRMGQKVAPKSRGKKEAAPEPTYPSEEVYAVPPLDTVLLDEKATKDLERRFMTVYDDDEDANPILEPLHLDRHVAHQRSLSRSSYFRKPGRVTQSFVRALRAMHAINSKSIDELGRGVPYYDLDLEMGNNVMVDNDVLQEDAQGVEGGWASDDPASQPVPAGRTAPKSQVAPKSKTPVQLLDIDDSLTDEDIWALDDPAPQPQLKGPSISLKDKTPVRAGRALSAMGPPPLPPTPRVVAPRTQPRSIPTPKTSAPRPKKKTPKTPRTPNDRFCAFAEEGASSSPPPTDPRFQLPSQAVDLGSQDTEGEYDLDDTQAYLMDSDLCSFIARDDEDVDAPPDSSLPDFDMAGFGRGTQAVVRSAARKKSQRKMPLKLFTSDATDNGNVTVSSDSDDEPVGRKAAHRPTPFVVDSDSDEDEDEVPLVPRKRARRVIDSDDEDD